jgi:V/A-type H+-transporting ATPase subunit E
MEMTGLDRITEEILSEAKTEAQAILDEAESKAEALIAKARSDDQSKRAALGDSVSKKLVSMAEARVSNTAQKHRQAILSAKQEVLGEALEGARKSLLDKPDHEYFEIVKKLAAKHAEAGSGELLLNARDLARLPKGFGESLNISLGSGKKLEIANETAAIDGGFLIRYGENIENCSFASLFRQRRDEFIDLAKEALFGE